MVAERLQKILAAAGVASRRKCEEMILEGAVRVNGQVVDTLPVFADADKDAITVDGRRIRSQRKVYYLLNKPKGVICTNYDPQGRVKATDIVACHERVFCAGRLDVGTTGLIILTNDNELANRITHPRYGVRKTYVARVKGRMDGDAAEKLKSGVWLAEGRTGRSAVKILKRGIEESLVEITTSKGLNREVGRMLARVGFSVKSLKRIRIGKIDDRGLGVGRFRALTGAEVAYLKRI
jgi:23S rRNA pseudouridine2605 synthase